MKYLISNILIAIGNGKIKNEFELIERIFVSFTRKTVDYRRCCLGSNRNTLRISRARESFVANCFHRHLKKLIKPKGGEGGGSIALAIITSQSIVNTCHLSHERVHLTPNINFNRININPGDGFLFMHLYFQSNRSSITLLS